MKNNSTAVPEYLRAPITWGALVLISLALFWPALHATLGLAWQSDNYTHILLVLPVSGLLIWLEGKGTALQTRPALAMKYSLLACISLVGAALLLSMLPPLRQNLTYRMFVLFSLWIALFICMFGFAAFRSLQFALLFLLLAVPLPSAWLEQAIAFLQAASAEASFLLFKWAGTPVLKNGFVLSLPSLDIEVATECSGIRSSEMMLLTCMVLGHLYLKSFWRQLLFALSVVPIAIVKNAIRIFTISMLGMHVNPGFLHGDLHRNGGIVFFAMGLGVLTALLWVLHKSENLRPGTSILAAAGRSA